MNMPEDEPTADAPVAPQRRSAREWAALAALGLMFLVVTKGPVYWVRREFNIFRGDFIDDAWIQTAFVASAALVIAIAAPGLRVIWEDRLVATVFSVFLVLVFLSTLWSVAPARTMEQSLMFLLGSAAALAAGVYLRRFDVLVTLWLAMQVGVGVSVFAWLRGWPRTWGGWQDQDFAGIYFNKNSLGPVALMGAAASIGLCLAAWRRGRWLLIPLALAALTVDVIVWLESNSLTALFGFVVAFVATALFCLFVPGWRARERRWVGAAAVVGAVAAAMLVLVSREAVNSRFGRRTTLSGRTEIWEVVLDYTAERPIHGWGFMSVWTKPAIIESLVAAGRNPVFEAHSGYFEVLLGVGIIGLAALVAVLVVVVWRVAGALWRSPSVMSAWSVVLLAYALTVNLTETFIGANLLPWVVLCVATAQAVVVRQGVAADVIAAVDVGDVDVVDVAHVADVVPLDPRPARAVISPALVAPAFSDDPVEMFDFSFDAEHDRELFDDLEVPDDVGAAADVAAQDQGGAPPPEPVDTGGDRFGDTGELDVIS